MQRRGFMLVLSSPSGAGKTTLSRRLLSQHDGLALSISVTTRPPRPRELDGQDYHFIKPADFDAMVQRNELLEHASVFDYHYGTPVSAVDEHLKQGRDVLFDIDWQGTRQLGQKRRDDLVSVFILPPSMAELERRLHQRGQDSDAVIAERMARAADEVSHWSEYDYVIVNTDLDLALSKLVHIIEAERQRRTRQTDLPETIATLCSPVQQTAPQ